MLRTCRQATGLGSDTGFYGVEQRMQVSVQPQSCPRSQSESRRSSRIPLSIRILVSGMLPRSRARFRAAGKTLVVSKHGALITTIPGLPAGVPINITVTATGKSAKGRIVWDGAGDEGRYGIELAPPENIWGVFFPPSDW